MEGASSSSNDDENLLVDDFYFSALCDEDKIFPISDEKYAEELQLQEALISSAIASSLTPQVTTQTQTTVEDVQTLIINLKGKQKEAGQSSESFCGICMDMKSGGEMFRNSGCSHGFCTDCIGTYVGTKIQENISMVKCPDVKCKCELEPQLCKDIVPKEVFDRWETALCEALILGSQRFYCPFKDCSAMLVDDGAEVVTVSECPHCRRLFCAQCKVAWHCGIGCGEFQSLDKDERQREDIMVIELAKQKNWKRCPKCNFFVEKTVGCQHITCRCGFEFCYGCGTHWRHSQFSSHVCTSVWRT